MLDEYSEKNAKSGLVLKQIKVRNNNILEVYEFITLR